jgi:hypothetical protein
MIFAVRDLKLWSGVACIEDWGAGDSVIPLERANLAIAYFQFSSNCV